MLGVALDVPRKKRFFHCKELLGTSVGCFLQQLNRWEVVTVPLGVH